MFILSKSQPSPKKEEISDSTINYWVPILNYELIHACTLLVYLTMKFKDLN